MNYIHDRDLDIPFLFVALLNVESIDPQCYFVS